MSTKGNVAGQETGKLCVFNDLEHRETSIASKGMEAPQTDVYSAKRGVQTDTLKCPKGHVTPVGTTISGRTDGGTMSLEAEGPEKRSKQKAPGEPMDGISGSDTKGR